MCRIPIFNTVIESHILSVAQRPAVVAASILFQPPYKPSGACFAKIQRGFPYFPNISPAILLRSTASDEYDESKRAPQTPTTTYGTSEARILIPSLWWSVPWQCAIHGRECLRCRKYHGKHRIRRVRSVSVQQRSDDSPMAASTPTSRQPSNRARFDRSGLLPPPPMSVRLPRGRTQ